VLPRYQIKNHQLLVRILLTINLFLFSVIGVNLSDYQTKNKERISIESSLIEKKENLSYLSAATVFPESSVPNHGFLEGKQEDERGEVASAAATLEMYLGFALEPISTERIKGVEKQISRKFNLLMGYIQWGNPDNSRLSESYLGIYAANNKIPIISWEPWDPRNGIEQKEYRLANIAQGKFDSYIREFAQELRNFAKPVFLRFAHEMNGNWYPWGGTVNGNSALNYQEAWRHVHDIFQQEKATNVNWIWSPDANSYPEFKGNEIADYYPGDNYVDWIGIDGYNWGPTKQGKIWESFDSIFSKGYALVLQYNKPIMLAEFASSEEGGDKASWIEETFFKTIPSKYPKIKAVVWFNINRETSWDIASSLSSVEKFKEIANSGIFAEKVTFLGSKISSPSL